MRACVCVRVCLHVGKREHVRLSASQCELFVSVYPYLNIPADSWASKAFLTTKGCNLCFVFVSLTLSKTEADFNKCFKRPEMYWFVRQNYANDREAVKSDKPDRAFTDGFCLCVCESLNIARVWVLCICDFFFCEFMWENVRVAVCCQHEGAMYTLGNMGSKTVLSEWLRFHAEPSVLKSPFLYCFFKIIIYLPGS